MDAPDGGRQRNAHAERVFARQQSGYLPQSGGTLLEGVLRAAGGSDRRIDE
jgi:hypothetical protein